MEMNAVLYAHIMVKVDTIMHFPFWAERTNVPDEAEWLWNLRVAAGTYYDIY